MQKLQATFHLQKYLVMEVNIIAMPPCCVAFMLHLGGKNYSIMIKKTMDLYVLLNLTSTTIIFASFDVLMFRNKVDTFALAINYLNESWTPMHVIVSLFEVLDTTRLSMGHG